MKKMIYTFVVVSTAGSLVFAQTQQAPATSASEITVTDLSQPQSGSASVANPTASAQAVVTVEQQPTTVIESSPLKLSKAEQMRKAREMSEIETEQKLVERLEEARLEAEAKRQQEIIDALNGKKTEEKKEETPVHQPAPQPAVVAPAPVAPIIVQPAPQPAPVVQGATAEEVRAAVKEEISSLKTEAPKKEEKKLEPVKGKSYISGNVGMIGYDSTDVETVGAVGVAFGKMFDDKWNIEFGVQAARAYVEEDLFLYRELEQYNLGVATRFMILPGRVRPHVGFLVNYVIRNYSELRDGEWGFSYDSQGLDSWALDYGLTAGVDFAMNENLSVGVEYRYMSNLTYEYNDEVLNTAAYKDVGFWPPLEERDSDFFGFSLKYMF